MTHADGRRYEEAVRSEAVHLLAHELAAFAEARAAELFAGDDPFNAKASLVAALAHVPIKIARKHNDRSLALATAACLATKVRREPA